MPAVIPDRLRRWALRAMIAGTSVLVLATVALLWLWQDRPSLDDIDWAPYPTYENSAGAVRVTWLGVSTLLFDDGDTQLLIDGFVSRPSLADLVLGRPVKSNVPGINYVMDRFGMRRLAAIIPVHSHFDHAMDVGAIANRSSASVLGSPTTANIARGAGVPEDQIVVVEDGSEYTFGKFTVTMLHSRHAPVGWSGTVPYAGTVDEPLRTPAPASAWREGQSYTIVLAHPLGTALVQGSAGMDERALEGVRADVVLLGVQLLETLGRDYAERYWQALVIATGASHVILVHFDDFTQPFGEVMLLPRVIENIVDVAGWLENFRDTWSIDTRLHLPRFGETFVLFPEEAPDA
jgi:L-ascorbate metabolism protein UlaG (beta-lactamase superfamily)